MTVRELITELIKYDMDSTVIIEMKNRPTSDATYISDGVFSVTDNLDEVIISGEW